jgi:hypothetical protein
MSWEWFFAGFCFTLGAATCGASILTIVTITSGFLNSLAGSEEDNDKGY